MSKEASLTQKIRLLRSLLTKHQAQQILFSNDDPNTNWLFSEQLSQGYLLITKHDVLLFIKPLESVQKNFAQKIRVIPVKKSSDIPLLVKKYLKGLTLLNYTHISLQDAQKFLLKKTKNISSELTELRSVKNPDELAKIIIACKHTVNCWHSILRGLRQRTLTSELAIARCIKAYALHKDLGLAFEPVVASGKNAGTPHHQSKKVLHKGFLVIDLGFTYKGFCSDMTRTIFLGTPAKQQRAIYHELLSIQEQLIQELPSYKSADKLHKRAQALMGKNKELFIHGLGHGVGVFIHEHPSIMQDSTDKIKAGQVLTIEPGYYTKQFGMRIEDTIHLAKTPNVLTGKASKKFISIKL